MVPPKTHFDTFSQSQRSSEDVEGIKFFDSKAGTPTIGAMADKCGLSDLCLGAASNCLTIKQHDQRVAPSSILICALIHRSRAIVN